MEVRVYDPTLKLMGIIENFSSLLWVRKYAGTGSFELHVPITQDSINYLIRGNLVAYKGAVEAGVIESIKTEQTKDKNTLVVAGRFLESYLDRRLVYNTFLSPTYNFSGTVEDAMRTLVYDAAIDDTNPEKFPIPLLQLGTDHGFTETITFQATYQNLLKYETKLAEAAGFGFRCIPDFDNKTITFDVYKGLDHSENQSERVRVIFSNEYKNLNNALYTENDQLYKTTCFVGGQGEGTDRVWVKVGDHTLTGLNRREVKLNATDITPESLTEEEYKAKLVERGEDLLQNTDILVQSFDCDVMPNGNFIYKTHYDIGDIITVKKENWGLSLDLRITDLTEIYEKGKVTVSPTFGTPLPDTIDWEDK